MEAKTVRAKPLPKPPVSDEITKSLLLLCYHYPQYTLNEARNLPFHHVLLLLDTARKEQASHYLELLNISTAPHTKKGLGVGKLARHYKKAAN